MPIEVEVSTTARLPCKVENPEETVIQWYKGPENNPTELFMGTLRQLQDFRFNMNPSDYTLTINNVTKNDSGIYTCDLLDQDIDERIVYELKVIDGGNDHYTPSTERPEKKKFIKKRVLVPCRCCYWVPCCYYFPCHFQNMICWECRNSMCYKFIVYEIY